VVGRSAPGALYQHQLATYDRGDQYDHSAAPGFISIYGLPARIQNQVQRQ
jgi:argininosuccinate synthase